MAASRTFPDIPSFRDSLTGALESSCAILHINVRSIRKYWDEFNIIVDSLRSEVDVFVLTEISISSDLTDQFTLAGFNGHFRTRPNGRGGGIAVFVKHSWLTSDLNVAYSSAECLALRVFNHSESVVLLACYRPPSENVLSFLKELETSLENINTTDNVCLIGDFNIDLIKQTKSFVCDYLTLLSRYGIESSVQTPTREEFLGNRLIVSCLDHVNIRVSNASAETAVIKQKLADHYFVACQLAFSNKNKQTSSMARQIEFVDITKLDSLVRSHDWHSYLSSANHINAYSKFLELFSSFKNSSKKRIHLKRRKANQVWLTADILSAIKGREALWQRCRRHPNNVTFRAAYNCERNRVNALIRSAKRRYFQHKFWEFKNNIAKTWSLLNEFRGSRSKHSIDDILENSFGADASSIVDSFNRYFASISGVARDHAVSTTYTNTSNRDSAYLSTLSEIDLRTIIFSFNYKKTAGVDGIRVGDLQRNFEALKEVLLFILNGFIETGRIPKQLKTAIVRPLFKGGTKNNLESYRPISILPTFALILEKHLFLSMTAFLEKCSFFSPTQFGFMAGRGTQSLLEELSDLLYTSFEQNQYACALFLDVSKAFDSISHKILLGKLFNAGFRGPFFSLLENFLTDRSQQVSACNALSRKVYLRSGVPQGSVLSPLLFNLYVNDISRAISNSHVFQYADDTLLVSKHFDYGVALRQLQSDAVQIMDWFDSNLISVNKQKTKLMCFHNPMKVAGHRVPFFLHSSSCVSCQCIPIEYVNSTKYLGIFLDSDLSWNSHLTYIAKRLRSVSCLLYRVRSFLPISVRKLITNALAYSILRYGITSFGNCSSGWQNKIDTILRGILKSVTYGSTLEEGSDIFKVSGHLNFCSLFKQTVVLNYYWRDSFKISRRTDRSLRSPARFFTPRVYTNYGKNVRSYYVPHIFNDLPDSVFECSSKGHLKRCLQEYFYGI